MAITPISEGEFLRHFGTYAGAKLMAETQAVIGLEEGTGIKLPCRWKHHGKYNSCAGAASLRQAAKRNGHNTTFRCKEGTLYIWRVM